MAKYPKQLLDAARAGDKKALEELLLGEQQRVYRFGIKLCKNPEDARDVLQDTLLTMARSIGDFRGTSSLSTWLYTIARSHCLKKRNRSKFAPKKLESLEDSLLAETQALAASPPLPDQAAAQGELGRALDAAIASLDPEQREVLILRDIEGLKAIEVAEILNLSVAAVKSRLHRARLSLRERLEPAFGNEALGPRAQKCPDVLKLYSEHLEGDISSDVCAKMERHLEACPHCHRACDSLKQTLSLCQNTASMPVPESVQASVRAALREFLATS